MKMTKKFSSLTALLLLATTFNAHSMKRKLSSEELKGVIGQVLVGDAPIKELLNNFDFKELPPEMQYTFIQLLSSDIAATSLKEAADTITSLSLADKELNELINEPQFCLRLIKNLAYKFNLADDEVIEAFHIPEAQRRLEVQNKFYTICYELFQGKIIDFNTEGIDVDFTYEAWDGYTALMMAAIKNNCPMIQLLLKNGANINKADYIGNPALMIAINSKQPEAIECLLSNPKIAINQQNQDGWTALMLAVYQDNCALIQLLLNKGADSNKTNYEGDTALIIAVNRKNTDTVKCLLKSPGIAIDTENQNEWTALTLAAANNDVSIIKLLLDKGANINRTDASGESALTTAVSYETTNAIQCLLNNPKIAINQQNINGMTTLMIATQKSNCPIIKLLLQYGADVNIPTKQGITALMIASDSGNINAAECLLSNSNLAIDQQNNAGGTALMIAAKKNNCPMIQLLLDKGANINIASNNGHTALMIAATYKNINAVKCLLSNPYIVINQENKNGLTALIMAAQRPNNQEIIDLIQNAIDK